MSLSRALVLAVVAVMILCAAIVAVAEKPKYVYVVDVKSITLRSPDYMTGVCYPAAYYLANDSAGVVCNSYWCCIDNRPWSERGYALFYVTKGGYVYCMYIGNITDFALKNGTKYVLRNLDSPRFEDYVDNVTKVVVYRYNSSALTVEIYVNNKLNTSYLLMFKSPVLAYVYKAGHLLLITKATSTTDVVRLRTYPTMQVVAVVPARDWGFYVDMTLRFWLAEVGPKITVTGYQSHVKTCAGCTFKIWAKLMNMGLNETTVALRLVDTRGNIVASNQTTIAPGEEKMLYITARAPESPGIYIYHLEVVDVKTNVVLTRLYVSVEIVERIVEVVTPPNVIYVVIGALIAAAVVGIAAALVMRRR